MKAPTSRREFLADVSRSTLLAAVGSSLVSDLGLSPAAASDGPELLTFGSLEPLVRLMQETPANKLLPILAAKLQSGVDLRQLTAAAALANARTFGGEDYIGFHTMMALAPAYHMSRELSGARQALPVFKVLYRNTNRIQERGGRSKEVLKPVVSASLATAQSGEQILREAVHKGDTARAEQTLAALAESSATDAFNFLLPTVQENTEVHRVVMPSRAWDLLGIIGREHALTLLRQSVRYCINAESWRKPAWNEPGALLTRMFDQHKLLEKTPGNRMAEDAWIDQLSRTIFNGTPAQAGEAAAAALAEGFAPDAVGEAISLAANQLVLRDHGRRPQEEILGKPIGSVHGDSIGVHACDSANAWRNMAKVTNVRNTYACLILGAHQVAHDRVERGGDFLKWEPVPAKWQLDRSKTTEPAKLVQELEEAIRSNLQAHAAAIVHRYGELGHPERPIFDVMLRYAVSEDGALHAEKYYRTVSEEFAATRSAFRWRQLVALARVTASEYGRPAAGVAETRELLGLEKA